MSANLHHEYRDVNRGIILSALRIKPILDRIKLDKYADRLALAGRANPDAIPATKLPIEVRLEQELAHPLSLPVQPWEGESRLDHIHLHVGLLLNLYGCGD